MATQTKISPHRQQGRPTRRRRSAAEQASALAEELSRAAVTAPALARLTEVVSFVGDGRPATQAGNLKPADALALARRLGTDERAPDKITSMADLPETAHEFRWAAAAGLLTRRGTKIVAGPLAADLERDPLSVWVRVAMTLLENGPLDGFRQGWRKSYVELLDASVEGLLTGLAMAGGRAPLASIEQQGWELVAAGYGYQLDDERERKHVAQLCRQLVYQLADIAIVAVYDDEVTLTSLGRVMAVASMRW